MKKVVLTALIIVSLLVLYIFWGGGELTKLTVNNKIEKLREIADFKKKEIFTYSQLNNLPPLLKKYFHNVILDSTTFPHFLTVAQNGKIKTSDTTQWFPLEAQEFFTTQSPNYLWDARLQTNKFFWVKTIDSYINGKGNMLIKVNSSITITDAWNIEMNKSGLFRYFSEALLFPTSLLPSQNLLWNILDSNKAEIKFKDKNNSIVAKVFFNREGMIEKIATEDKYRSTKKGYMKTPYTIYYSNYKLIKDKFIIPMHYEVEWSLPNGKFRYGKFDVKNIFYE
jgi:hypothetical protein